VELNRNSGETYQARSAECTACKLRGRCIAERGGKSPKRTPYITDQSKGENLIGEMRKKTGRGKYRALYERRRRIVDPCFADMRHCKGMDRFSLRGKQKVNIQRLLYCMVHNMDGYVFFFLAAPDHGEGAVPPPLSRGRTDLRLERANPSYFVF
jgi:hypothetical protein